MIIADLLGWWYSRGWVWVMQYFFVIQIKRTVNFFSIADLLKTLFAPFRQDSLQLNNAPISIRLQAFGGNIISRIFGLLIRSTLIIFGIIIMVAQVVVGFVMLLLWPLAPISPMVSVVLMVTKVGL